MIVCKYILAVLILISVNSCAAGYLKTVRTEPSSVSGSYTLLLHGSRYGDDVENVAILDKEGDAYSFKIAAPEFDYTVQKGVAAGKALEEAEGFVRSHRAFMSSRLSGIIDGQGNIIGYEVRPLYIAHEFGLSDILYIDYRMKDNTVITYIRVKYDLEKKGPFLFRERELMD
ncbi:MAG: hypothetical protein HZA16_16000 [Nitrospirae bacterium]|nr:hypothetical protein [Nitrospirota bacterium]